MQCLGHYILQNVNIKSISSIKLLETMDRGKRVCILAKLSDGQSVLCAAQLWVFGCLGFIQSEEFSMFF